MTRSDRTEDREVVESTAALLRRCWALVGDPLQPPFRTDQLATLLAASGTRLCEFPFRSTTVGMAIPWGAGEHAILIDSAASRADYAFTIRHELAHVLSGEVSEALFLSAADTMSFSERRADLFAVADLVPAWMVARLRGTRRPWSHVRLEVQHTFRELTEGWSEERVLDRATLRMAMFREQGL